MHSVEQVLVHSSNYQHILSYVTTWSSDCELKITSVFRRMMLIHPTAVFMGVDMYARLNSSLGRNLGPVQKKVQ